MITIFILVLASILYITDVQFLELTDKNIIENSTNISINNEFKFL